MIVLTFDSEQLNKVIQNALRSVLADVKPTPSSISGLPELLTRQEAANLAGVCLATIDNKVRDGILKKYRTGGIVRFKKQEIIEAFSQSAITKNPRRKVNFSGRRKNS